MNVSENGDLTPEASEEAKKMKKRCADLYARMAMEEELWLGLDKSNVETGGEERADTETEDGLPKREPK